MYVYIFDVDLLLIPKNRQLSRGKIVPRPGKDPSNDAANVRSGLRKNTLINSTCGMYVRVSRNPMSFAMALFCTSCCYRNFQFFISLNLPRKSWKDRVFKDLNSQLFIANPQVGTSQSEWNQAEKASDVRKTWMSVGTNQERCSAPVN